MTDVTALIAEAKAFDPTHFGSDLTARLVQKLAETLELFDAIAENQVAIDFHDRKRAKDAETDAAVWRKAWRDLRVKEITSTTPQPLPGNLDTIAWGLAWEEFVRQGEDGMPAFHSALVVYEAARPVQP